MCCNLVAFPISSCVSLFDGLHDPSADMTSHDVSDGAVSMNEQPLLLERHSKHEDMNIVSLKPKLTGTLFSWSAILVE